MSKIELFENERASGYNQFVETWIPNYDYFLDHLPALLHDTLGERLLVVGCGTGNEIARFVSAPKVWKIMGVDPSPEMFSQAKEKFQDQTDVTLMEGLVTDLPGMEKYDASTLLLVLHFLPDDGSKLALLKDISARLLPGAPLVLLDITGDKNQISQNLTVLKRLLPNGISEEQIAVRLNRIENELFAVSEERLKELLTEAGFKPPLRFFQSAIYMGWWAEKCS